MADGSRAVLKRWPPSRGHRCIAECRALIGADHSPLTPRVSKLVGRLLPLVLDDGSYVTAREFVIGRRFRTSDENLAALGRGLGQLHQALQSSQPEHESRLATVARISPADRVPTLGAALRQAHQVLAASWEDILQLPKTAIHGDPTWANLLVEQGELRFIDFEFSRYDLRVLDLVPAFAGDRDPATGAFITLGPRAVQRVADAYANTTPLTCAERRLLPEATLAFFLMVGHDLAASRPQNSHGLESVIATAVKWTISSRERARP